MTHKPKIAVILKGTVMPEFDPAGMNLAHIKQRLQQYLQGNLILVQRRGNSRRKRAFQQ
jgi:hypothetical protein